MKLTLDMIAELNKHHRTKLQIMEQCVIDRLDRDLAAYIEDSKRSFSYLKYHPTKKLIKGLNDD